MHCISGSGSLAFHQILFFLAVIPLCHAVLVNRTIDSNKGDLVTNFMPIYQPQSHWDDQNCAGCWIQPDRTKAFDGTWNAATYNPNMRNVNITLLFTGVAVWVFFILSNANDHGIYTTTNTWVNITLDGKYVGTFSHDPDMTTHDLIYNATIFSTSGLANILHELVIGANDFPNFTFINFDWAIYSVEVDAPMSQNASSSIDSAFPSTIYSPLTVSTSTPTPQSSSSKTGIIVGSTLGVLAVVALALVFFVRCHGLRREFPVQTEKAEGPLRIGARGLPPRPHPYINHAARPGRELNPSYTARFREEELREIDERIQSVQQKMDNLTSIRNTGYQIGSPSSADPPLLCPPGISSLHNEMQQLRDQIRTLHVQQEPESVLHLAGESLPPAYTQN